MTDPDTRFERGIALFRSLGPDGAAQMEAVLRDLAPDLVRLIGEVPFADIFTRPGLAPRARQIATLAALATRGDASAQLAIHVGIALRLGLSPGEIVELFIQLVPYAGFPTAIEAIRVAKPLLEQHARRPA